jgi:O-antigen ligase
MSFQQLLSALPLKSSIPISLRGWLSILIGCIMGILAAYLLVEGEWSLVIVLIFVLPMTILIFKHPIAAVMIWLLLAPFLVTTETSAERMIYWLIHRALPPLTVGILGMSFLIRARKFPRLSPAEFAMIGYIIATLFSIALVGTSPQRITYEFYDRVFSPMCLYLIIRLTAPGEREIRRFVPIFFFIGVSQAIIGILSWIAPQTLPHEWLRLDGQRTTGSLVSYSVYTTTIVFCSLFLLHTAFNSKPGLTRTLYLSFFLLSIFCVIISFSRGSWLAQIFVTLGLVYLYPKFTIRWILIVVPVSLFIVEVLLADYLYDPAERLSEAQPALSRLPIALASYRMFEAKPVFGWGYGNFNYYDRRFQERVLDLVNARKDHSSHNLYLATLAEQGLVGLTLFLAPAIWWLFQTIAARKRVPSQGFLSRNLIFLLWLVILNHFVVNNFSHMRIEFGLGMWWFTLALIANQISQLTDRVSSKKIGSYSRAVSSS